MKPTLSVDGRYRINLRVVYRLDLERMADALAFHYRYHLVWEDGPLPDLGKARLVNEIKEELEDSGLEHIALWREHLNQDDVEAWEDWSKAQVLAHFPDLGKEAGH
ncbi:hypothetical protein NX794_07785 [Streptomyces sp. LP11]|uniref:Uncharacterized protein n=1 Tax=Streptomyces pyxinicus TaxID=2970331 RepID=A0ABT2AY07_9ACTN|nr:hypothetical protein [Streptomyces sp. LP11]MCS0601131.1 hypothetical protein [Streptomyces sp. LP11]